MLRNLNSLAAPRLRPESHKCTRDAQTLTKKGPNTGARLKK